MAGSVFKSSKKTRMSRGTRLQKGKPLPVTLLSGFLGSGKTTLLQHILRSNHGLRIAIIVNDIGSINVDASLIQSTHRIRKTKEKLIALSNGCICCTLRGDLLSELIELSEQHSFDYVIIESSGISEPGQVAESFDGGLSEHMLQMAKEQGDLDPKLAKALKKLHEAGDAGLTKFARLDTTVTVIDAFTILSDFDTAEVLSDRRDDVVPEDERTVSHLMVDQIEFADVIVLNKTDMVNEEVLDTIKGLVRTLNRNARVLCSSYGKVDVAEVVGTGSFDLERARTGAGWLESLHEMMVREINGKNVITPKPETEEYNVRKFTYSRRRPFHPERLMRLVYDKFILQHEHSDDEDEDIRDEPRRHGAHLEQEVYADDEAWESDEDADMPDSSTPPSNGSRQSSEDTVVTSPTSTRGPSSRIKADMSCGKAGEDALITPSNEIIRQNKSNHPLFARLFRSKCTALWFATRPDYQGVWSQAGPILQLVGGHRWFCTLTPDQLSSFCQDEELSKQLQHDIDGGGEWGDRRQELVFIGENLNVKGIEALLDECLLNDEEWELWQSRMRVVKDKQEKLRKLEQELQHAKDALTGEFLDGFPEWEAHFQDEEEDDEEEEDGDDHDHHHH